MDWLLKTAVGAFGGTALLIAGQAYYPGSGQASSSVQAPNFDFEYDVATETEKTNYLNGLGDYFVTGMKKKHKSNVLSFEGVSTEEREIYLTLSLDELLKGKDIPDSLVFSPEFGTLMEKQFLLGFAQKCDEKRISKFFELDLSMVIDVQMSGQTVTDLELSKSVCAETIG
ncbi:MAG: hypothetical protein ABJN04_11875 [Hyphomicrobiales bacterium]